MGRTAKYYVEIERLLDNGYNINEVVGELNISSRTVYRVLDKLKKQARYDFKNLMQEDFLWKYQKTLENFDKTIRQCNEQISTIGVKYDDYEHRVKEELDSCDKTKYMARATLLGNLINIQSNRTNELQKLVTARDRASDNKAKVYNQGPVVNSIDNWVHQTTPSAGELPVIPEIKKIILKKTHTELNSTDNTNKLDEITDEDRAVLEEMEKDGHE